MNAEIAAVEEKTSVMKSRLGRLVTGFDYPIDQRSQILLAYNSIMAEHHSAIFLLIQKDLCGTAFALVRPVYELLYRAHWIVACASAKDITRIFEGKDVFPKMCDLVLEIDQAYKTDDFWRTIKAATWSPMNDYTHSGIRQIGRRFTGNEVMQNYEVREILEVLNGVNVALILTTHLFFNYFDKPEACHEVEEIFTSYMLHDHEMISIEEVPGSCSVR